MIDLLAFLSGETEMSFNTEDLDRQIYPSKRNGFIEISGTMSLSTKRGDILELTDSGASKKYEMEITIDTGQEFYRINEVSRKVLLSRDSGVLEKEIEIPLQSECTGNIIDKMLNTGKSSLTTYEGCMIYHVSMLKAFNDHFCTVTGEKIVACPIT
jgi:hypothetical protein